MVLCFQNSGLSRNGSVFSSHVLAANGMWPDQYPLLQLPSHPIFKSLRRDETNPPKLRGSSIELKWARNIAPRDFIVPPFSHIEFGLSEQPVVRDALIEGLARSSEILGKSVIELILLYLQLLVDGSNLV